jgi:hypothetical protein
MLKKCSEWLVSNTLSNKDKLKVGQHLICDQPREGDKWIGRMITWNYLQSHTILMTVGEVGHAQYLMPTDLLVTQTPMSNDSTLKRNDLWKEKNWC